MSRERFVGYRPVATQALYMMDRYGDNTRGNLPDNEESVVQRVMRPEVLSAAEMTVAAASQLFEVDKVDILKNPGSHPNRIVRSAYEAAVIVAATELTYEDQDLELDFILKNVSRKSKTKLAFEVESIATRLLYTNHLRTEQIASLLGRTYDTTKFHLRPLTPLAETVRQDLSDQIKAIAGYFQAFK